VKVHHTAVCTRDVDSSLQFWRDGLGFTVLMDRTFAGDWPTLFGARQPQLRSLFLGEAGDDGGGLLELVEFVGGADDGRPPPPAPATGFLLVSVYGAVEPTLRRLADMGLGGPPRWITLGRVEMAVVHDPNGVAVELIDLGTGDG
jgi:catechol 2,3-dioxygenase-like lactoylglutathione lyase family enzyme